jgi:hypothetical protein
VFRVRYEHEVFLVTGRKSSTEMFPVRYEHHLQIKNKLSS